MDSQRVYARIAGFTYLLLIVLGLAGLAITSRIAVGGTVPEVARSVAASEHLYRIGLCLGLAESLCALLLAVSLYVTVKPVDVSLATMALLFRLVEVVTGAVASVMGFATLQLYLDAHRAGGFDASQWSALTDLSAAAGAAATNVSIVSFSVGSTIFFSLFLRSGYIPRILSAGGVFGSVVFAAVGLVNLVLPEHASAATLGYAPITVAEVSTALWLLIRGVEVRPREGAPAGGRAPDAPVARGRVN